MNKKGTFRVTGVYVCAVNRLQLTPGGGLRAHCERIEPHTKLTDHKVMNYINSVPHDKIQDVDVVRCIDTSRGLGITARYYYEDGRIKNKRFPTPIYDLISKTPE